MCEKQDSVLRKSLTDQEKKIKVIRASGGSKGTDADGMSDLNERTSSLR